MTPIQRTAALAVPVAIFALVAVGQTRTPRDRFLAGLPRSAPRKLSDLYRFFTRAIAQGLGTDLRASSVRLRGQSWELVRDARFPEAEVTLRPFQAQGLDFTKGGFLFRGLEVHRRALYAGILRVRQVREVQSRMVFTLRSLARKLGQEAGSPVHLRADMESQQVEINGTGAFCGWACPVEERCGFVWDESARTLRMAPLSERFGGHKVPRWLWPLGRGPVPRGPVLDFGFSWIPFNIQEVHVGWDEVDLSTDW